MNLFKLLITPLVNTTKQQEPIDFTDQPPNDPPVLYVPPDDQPANTNIVPVPIEPRPRRRNRSSGVWFPNLRWSSSSTIPIKSVGSIKQIVPEIVENECVSVRTLPQQYTQYPPIETYTPLRIQNTPENGTIVTDRNIHPYHILVEALLEEPDIDNYNFYCMNVSKNLLPYIKKYNHLVDTIENADTYSSVMQTQCGSNKSISCPDFTKTSPWVPPKTHGLQNCNKIIPDYYFQSNKSLYGDKMLNIDYLWMIKDDIRNMRKLNEHQIAYIQNLEDDEKNDIIIEFHESRNMMIEVLNMRSTSQSRNMSTRPLLDMAAVELNDAEYDSMKHRGDFSDNRRLEAKLNDVEYDSMKHRGYFADNQRLEAKLNDAESPSHNIRTNMPRNATL